MKDFKDKYDGLNYRKVTRDGEPVRQIQCPECNIWGDIDDDQFHGRVSIDCPECEFHHTINVAELTEEEDCGC